MIGDKSQHQSGGDASNNFQAQNIYVSGLSASEARQIALDVYKANFLALSQEAIAIATVRAERITDAFIAKLSEQAPNLLNELRAPGMQLALFAAQKEYARTGENYVEDLLVTLLVDRTKQRQRNLRQIALEESIAILPKLTEKQVDILTLSTLISDHYFEANSLSALQHYLSNLVVKFRVSVRFMSPDIRHLDFTGCAKVAKTSRSRSLSHNLQQSYPGLFPKGFTREEFAAAIPNWERYESLLIPCTLSPGKLQLDVISTEGINQFFSKHSFGNEEKKPIFDFLKSNAMEMNAVKAYLLKLEPGIDFLFSMENHDVLNLEISPVGIAIACANFFRKVGRPLSWPYHMRDE